MSQTEQLLQLVLDGYEVVKEDYRLSKIGNEFLIQSPNGGHTEFSSPIRAVQEFMKVKSITQNV